MTPIEALTTFLEESNKMEGIYDLENIYESGEAWNYAVDERKNFGVNYVCGIHKRLMSKLNPEIAGKLRKDNIYISNNKTINTIPSKDNKFLLKEWCNKYSNISNPNNIKKAHIDFERIHPFIEGNGCVGRIIYNVQRLNLGLPIEVFYEKNKQQYHQWFK